MVHTINDNKIVKARKEHRCDFCFMQIKKGEKHNHAVYKYEDIYQFRTHLKCDLLARKLDMYDDCGSEGVTGETFQDYVLEAWYEHNRGTDPRSVEYEQKLEFVLNHFLKTE